MRRRSDVVSLLLTVFFLSAATSADWTKSVRLVSVTYDEWQRELARLRGRIVVVDHWATWCAPCVERFPHMIAMSKRWDPKRVTFVSLSLDDRDEPGSFAHVLEFLEHNHARIPNYLMNEVNPDAFEKLNLNSVPAVVIYDAKGKMRYRLTGDNPDRQYTDADVEKAVKELVAEH
jgi:thiol-disulfide isomerase/thioredoxin